VHGTVTALGEYAERQIMVQYIVNLRYHLEVLGNGVEAVPLTGYGHNFKETQGTCRSALVEDVRPRAEHCSLLAGLKNHKGIHQSIAMIRSYDYGPSVGGQAP
jgi:hypothetical protein